jgi:hypothetical protein
MNKKQLMTLVNSLVCETLEADKDLGEAEARTLVGIAIRQHRASIIAKCVGHLLTDVVEPEAVAAV